MVGAIGLTTGIRPVFMSLERIGWNNCLYVYHPRLLLTPYSLAVMYSPEPVVLCGAASRLRDVAFCCKGQ